MTAPDVTSAVERAAKVLRAEVDGHRVAAVIERGVMWSLEPLVEEWRVVRDAKQDPDILTRFVRESCSSRDNARRQDEVADAIETILSDHARLSAALGEATKPAAEPLRMDAYYYGFELTGVGIIDRILSAVASAGKAFHHTDDWTDDTWSSGPSEQDKIQWVANQPALDLLRARTALQQQEARDGRE